MRYGRVACKLSKLKWKLGTATGGKVGEKGADFEYAKGTLRIPPGSLSATVSRAPFPRALSG